MADVKIRQLQDLLAAAAECSERFGDGEVWWRGHSCLEGWPLLPSVFRDRDPCDGFEQNIAARFIQSAPTMYENCPGQSPGDASRWLFLMQHYGLPTRLLDWTESILIAAYFTVCNDKWDNQDGAIWGLSAVGMNNAYTGKRVVASETDTVARQIYACALNTKNIGKLSKPIVPIRPIHIDKRMAAQSSAFTLHGNTTAIENLEDNDAYLARYVVPSSAKPRLKDELNLYKISRSKLFPDLVNLSKELKTMSFQQ